MIEFTGLELADIVCFGPTYRHQPNGFKTGMADGDT